MVGVGLASIMKYIYPEVAESLGKIKLDEEVEAWFTGIKSDRCASDVFVRII